MPLINIMGHACTRRTEHSNRKIPTIRRRCTHRLKPRKVSTGQAQTAHWMKQPALQTISRQTG